jgi:hypothetical protein
LITAAKKQLQAYLEKRGYLIRRTNTLTSLANASGSDKGTLFTAHFYTRVYDRFFRHLRNDPLTILEIGLHRPENDKRRSHGGAEGSTSAKALSAPSLEMWRAYFPKATIYGFDIDDFTSVRIPGCSILRGDMSSRDDLNNLAQLVARPFDIIIEDASHVSHHQQIALGTLLPYVRPGGLYIIEDLHWQDPKLEKYDAPKTVYLLKKLQVLGVFESPYLSKSEQSYIQENVDHVWLFDSLTYELCSDPGLRPPNGDGSDAIAVIRKK